jgi:hypothetical protein
MPLSYRGDLDVVNARDAVRSPQPARCDARSLHREAIDCDEQESIYWNNHHHMLHAADRINGRILAFMC